MDVKILSGVVILAVIVVIVGLFLNYGLLMPPADQGRLVVTLTDAAEDMDDVTEINVTIDSIRVHNDVNAWVTLSSKQQTFDLLELEREGDLVVIADLNIPARQYNQIEFNISRVIVVAIDGNHEAKLPSGKIRMNMDVNLAKESTSAISFDVIADESLHLTGNGLYILAPVIHVQTRENVVVNIDSRNNASIMGGQLKNNVQIGMNANGEVNSGYKMPVDADISVGNDGKIRVGLN